MVIVKRKTDVLRMISSGLTGIRKSLYSLQRSIEPTLKELTKRNIERLNRLATPTIKELGKRRKRLQKFILSLRPGRGETIPASYKRDIDRISKKLDRLSRQIKELRDSIDKGKNP